MASGEAMSRLARAAVNLSIARGTDGVSLRLSEQYIARRERLYWEAFYEYTDPFGAKRALLGQEGRTE